VGERIRVIGVGNPDRGDDGVGPAVAGRVAESTDSTVVVISRSDPSRLIESWDGSDAVVVIDAIVDDNPAGSIMVLDAATQPIPDDAGAVTSHGMGLGASVALARSLGRLPDRLMLVGVSATDFEGRGLSKPVADAVSDAVEIVIGMVKHA